MLEYRRESRNRRLSRTAFRTHPHHQLRLPYPDDSASSGGTPTLGHFSFVIAVDRVLPRCFPPRLTATQLLQVRAGPTEACGWGLPPQKRTLLGSARTPRPPRRSAHRAPFAPSSKLINHSKTRLSPCGSSTLLPTGGICPGPRLLRRTGSTERPGSAGAISRASGML